MFGKKKQKEDLIKTLVAGEDRNVRWPKMISTGVNLVERDTVSGYDSIPNAIGVHVRGIGGNGTKPKTLGAIAFCFEPMARPYDFIAQDWAIVNHKKDVLLSTGRSEARARVTQELSGRDKYERMTTVLLIVVAIVGLFALLFAFQGNVFQKLIGAIGG